MRKFFYPRLAVSNLVKNKTIYLPYLLAGSLMVMLYYSLYAVGEIGMASEVYKTRRAAEFVGIGGEICQYLVAVVLFYINSFVMKRRKKEFGLFSILGMEKRHLGLLVLCETVLCAVCTAAVGILLGILCAQLGFLVLTKLVGDAAALTFTVAAGPIGRTLALFGVIWGLILVYDLVSVWRLSPIQLLQSSRQGEKEPPARWVLTLIGLAVLAAGYGLALNVKDTAMALVIFFPAAILVIIGTYALFMAGSITLLKFLKKRRKFYYKPQNFIAVSGMIYRMKQNAAGLASICILATMVMVTLSGTLALYSGAEEVLNYEVPREVNVRQVKTDDIEAPARLRAGAATIAERLGVEVTNEIDYFYTQVNLRVYGAELVSPGTLPDDSETNVVSTLVLSAEDFHTMTGMKADVAAGQGLVYRRDQKPAEVLTLGEHSWQLAPLPTASGTVLGGGGMFMLLVLPTQQDVDTVLHAVDTDVPLQYTMEEYRYGFDFAGDAEKVSLAYAAVSSGDSTILQPMEEDGLLRSLTLRSDYADNIYSTYGGILFMGIFFVSLFLLTTVLIIYYKQVSEGYDDRDRFVILQKVGMSQKEVRRTIQKQVLMVFFLPLGMAALHMAFAFPALCRILRAFSMTNIGLFALCTVGTLAAFAALYGLVYHLTARTYFKLVRA